MSDVYSLSVPDPRAERLGMVRRQIEARDVTDAAVLTAMRTVPRHEFVPEHLRAEAYDDRPLPLGWEQTISQPYIVAHMSQLAHLRGGETVLEVGTGSGYQAAVLAEIAARVHTIEIVEPLLRRAAQTLQRLAYRNVVSRFGDGRHGWKEAGPFDAILVTAAPAKKVPPALLEQLADGGRLIAPVGRFDQRLEVILRQGKRYERRYGTAVRFVPLVGNTVE
ncbi:MAG: protein-L-isoaspartate(D-aspartate) O-methyltransferase [Planctomycetota bacterium]|jgi:protein-L-isoaspartate(D-aspartate) O-methyltransferase